MPASSATLLAWYDANARRLPWRVPPEDRRLGVVPDPYRVWLSEVMLQQTTVAAVRGHFERFTDSWPTVADLAAAPREAVMAAWAGLGYYSRARNLKAAAEAVIRDHGGRFPQTAAALAALPGIGPYTAAAIAAIAFDEAATVVDGNVERVIARLHGLETPLPAAKPEIRALAAARTPTARPGDYAQAMMDLGATICTPKAPACAICPLADDCAGRRRGDPERFPRRSPKAERPTRRGHAFVVSRADGALMVRRRPDRGLLGGMLEVPGSAWTEAAGEPAPPVAAAFADAGAIAHSFTHFHLVLTVWRGRWEGEAPDGCHWLPAAAIAGEAFPSVMRKAIALVLPQAGRPRTGRRTQRTGEGERGKG